jgi:hypothetical protein
MKLYYIWTFIITSSIIAMLVSRKQTSNTTTEPQTEHNNCVQNILKYPGIASIIAEQKDVSIYILQTTTCNVCKKSSIDSLQKKESRIKAAHLIVLLLQGHKSDIDGFIKIKFGDRKLITLYDIDDKMPALGLHFFKNVCVDIRDRKILRWEFID